jgi:hypothetical protein
MSGSDIHMINLWNLNLICHFNEFGIFYYYFYLLLLRFGIYLHLVIANKILTNLKAMLGFSLYFIDLPYTSHELPPLASSCHIIPHNLLSDEHV